MAGSRTRFAPSPTGSLHVGNALSAVAARTFGDWLLLRIDDTDPARNVPGGEEAILRDLEWLGVEWDEGPVRQSERADRHREAAGQLGARFDGITLLREDGRPTYQLASVVDDIDFGITHIVRGNDHRPNEALHQRLFARARRGAAAVRAPRADSRTGRKEAVEACGGSDGGVASRGRHSRRGGQAPISRSSGSPRARRAVRPVADSAACRSMRSRRCRTRSWRARRRAGERRAGAQGRRDLNEAREYAGSMLGDAPGRRRARDARALPRAGERRCVDPKAIAPRAQGRRRRPSRTAPGADRP